MNTLICITPTGGRPDAFAQCERLMARQTRKPDLWIVIDDVDPPTKTTMGQVVLRPEPRWPNYVQQTTQHRNIIAALDRIDSIEAVSTRDASLIMWEDDDHYAPGYIAEQAERLKSCDLSGEGPARYYHVRNGCYRVFEDTPHASLCATAMRASLIPELRDLCEMGAWIDVGLWKRCGSRGKLYNAENVIGMKGMPGRPGVSQCHKQARDPRWTFDPDGAKLREWTGPDAAFYLGFRPTEKQRQAPAVIEWDETLGMHRIKREGRPDRFRCGDCSYDHWEEGMVMKHWMEMHAPAAAKTGPLFDDGPDTTDRKIIVPGKE